MTRYTRTAAFVAAALLASTAPGYSKDVNNAIVTGIEPTGVTGANAGCLHVFYTDVERGTNGNRVKMPYVVVNPNTAQDFAGQLIIGKPNFSFNFGPKNPLVCDRADFKDAPTLTKPSWGNVENTQ